MGVTFLLKEALDAFEKEEEWRQGLAHSTAQGNWPLFEIEKALEQATLVFGYMPQLLNPIMMFINPTIFTAEVNS